MKLKGLYIIILFFIGCSPKFIIEDIKSIDNNKQEKNVLYLSGKINAIPTKGRFYSAILLLYYNDSTKVYAPSDFDGDFTFYNFKPNLLNNKSYVLAANKGFISKKILYDSLKKPIKIKLKEDTINGLSYNKYIEFLVKNRPID